MAAVAVSQFEPGDQYNRTLAANVHPSDWVNPAPKRRYNLVVIGGGTAGLVTAAGAAGLGANVALVEKNLLGGDCLNFGCVPSKALIRAARAAAEMRDAAAYGIPPVHVRKAMVRMSSSLGKRITFITKSEQSLWCDFAVLPSSPLSWL